MPAQSVLDSFGSHFGKETNARWEKTGQLNYQATFKQNGHAVTVSFDGRGKWLKTEKELLPSELPSVVISTIVGAYRGSSIHKAFQVDRENRTYRIILKERRHLSTVELTADGVIISKLSSE